MCGVTCCVGKQVLPRTLHDVNPPAGVLLHNDKFHLYDMA
jgi:hypothetical protein